MSHLKESLKIYKKNYWIRSCMYKIYYHVPFKSINFHYYYLNSANSHTLHVLIAAGRNMKYMIVIMVMVPSIVCLYQVS